LTAVSFIVAGMTTGARFIVTQIDGSRSGLKCAVLTLESTGPFDIEEVWALVGKTLTFDGQSLTVDPE
jgi:hypothetical protein